MTMGRNAYDYITVPDSLKVVRFWYTNYKGEYGYRSVIRESVELLANPGFGYAPGWFMNAWDPAREVRRSYSLDRMEFGTDTYGDQGNTSPIFELCKCYGIDYTVGLHIAHAYMFKPVNSELELASFQVLRTWPLGLRMEFYKHMDKHCDNMRRLRGEVSKRLI